MIYWFYLFIYLIFYQRILLFVKVSICRNRNSNFLYLFFSLSCIFSKTVFSQYSLKEFFLFFFLYFLYTSFFTVWKASNCKKRKPLFVIMRIREWYIFFNLLGNERIDFICLLQIAFKSDIWFNNVCKNSFSLRQDYRKIYHSLTMYICTQKYIYTVGYCKIAPIV